MKDNFSSNSDLYSLYRPSYPIVIYEFIKSKLGRNINAWDCGTGNGQVAGTLAKFFKNVYATDISQSQLDNAISNSKIIYSLQPAEKTNFPNQIFDLVTVAQAIHWFNFEAFYSEVKRTIKPDGLFVILGYNLVKIDHQIDMSISHFYKNIIGDYWDAERKYIDENYQTIPFPFKELSVPSFSHQLEWTFEQFIGYLNTWSAVKHFIRKKGTNPVALIENELRIKWGGKSKRTVNFPILLRVGKLD